jgi:hypothetical protein
VDSAREVLRLPYGAEDNWEWDLDRLEACVVPAPQPTIDRDAAERYVREQIVMPMTTHKAAVDALLALVRPVEQQTIDRDVAAKYLVSNHGMRRARADEVVDRILALAGRPVEPDPRIARIEALIEPYQGEVRVAAIRAILNNTDRTDT